MNLIRTLLATVALFATGLAVGDETSVLRDAGPGVGIRLAGGDDPAARKTYIVRLREPAAAAAFSRLAVAAPKPAGERATRFDKSSAFAQGYTEKLREEQERVLAIAGPDAEKIYSYTYGLNGFAARMTPAEAHKLEARDEVLGIWEDEIRPLTTNFSAEFLDLFDNTNGIRGDYTGEDVIIAFIDSGIYPEHPALTDTQEADRPRTCRSSWGRSSLLGRWLCRRYNRAEDKLVYEPPEEWNGICEAGEQFEETACNNKLVGARWFIAGAEAGGAIDAGEFRSARDVDGHGTHTATTAAGNRVDASIFGTRIGTVEGIAPRARVAAYKACWLRPGEQRASCNTSDLAAAVDAAVADGVDIINYSVGSSLTTVTAPDDIALLAATKAGVLSIVSAGNDGPNLTTIGSPAGGPWSMTVGASSRDGETSLEAMQINSPPDIAGKYASREASFTPALADRDPIEASLVLADDDDTSLTDGGDGTTSDACQALVNTTEMDGNIALIQRGGCDFDIKVANAEDAGAVAAVVYNIAGEPFVMNGATDLSDIPAIMVGGADGELFIEELDAGNDVEAVLDKGFFLNEPEDGNLMATFSSRGPGPVRSILKPDVTAPGVRILAGITPDAVNSTPGEQFGYLSGTSMSAPHVAGSAALLRQAHPGWSPAAIKSALMTTARQSITRDDGETDANPFDFGAGHIVPNAAVSPGLVYDASDDDYDAFACGAGIDSIVSAERCDELETGGASFLARDLNQPSIAVARLSSSETVSRRVTNVSDDAANYSVGIEPPIGIAVAVNPPALSLGPGESASYDVTFTYQSGQLDTWRFGAVTWSDDETDVRSPLAIKPVTLTAPLEITSFGGTGSVDFSVEFGYSGTYAARVHGLRLPSIIDGFVDNDPTKTFSFRAVDGVTSHLVDVPADQLYLRFATFDALTDGDDDLDMYVYFCADNVNCTLVDQSGGPTAQERVDLFRPAAGRYAVLIHGFETDEVAGGPGSNYQLLAWSFGELDDQGNMSVSGPAFVNPGTTETVTVNWTDLLSNAIYFGGISHNTPFGLSALTLITIGN
ncbi:MAG: S8 family serine peptidase [Woeseiaceae bacterium]|nr:S8 family serine peptidase [Woeseiaceae bacterium]